MTDHKPLTRIVYTHELNTEKTGVHECAPECDCTFDEDSFHDCELAGEEYERLEVMLPSDVRSAVEGLRYDLAMNSKPYGQPGVLRTLTMGEALALLDKWFPVFKDKENGDEK